MDDRTIEALASGEPDPHTLLDMTKYQPGNMNVPSGPWEAIAENETEPYKVVGRYVVASDLPCEDAWLIAAAPDLFSALSSFVSDCDNDGCERCIQAKAALAKARGERDKCACDHPHCEHAH